MADEPPQLSLADSAVAMHELFLSLVKAGFTKREAITLLGEMFRQQAQ